MLIFENQQCTIFSPLFCFMFLIGAIKHIAEKKLKTSFISLRSRFDGGKKNFIQKKGEKLLPAAGKILSLSIEFMSSQVNIN